MWLRRICVLGFLRSMAASSPNRHARPSTAVRGRHRAGTPSCRMGGRAVQDEAKREGRGGGDDDDNQHRRGRRWCRSPGGPAASAAGAAETLRRRPRGKVGEQVGLGGRPFTVGGIAVGGALPNNGLGFLMGSAKWPNPGLVWVTRGDAESLATAQHPLSWVLGCRHGRAPSRRSTTPPANRAGRVGSSPGRPVGSSLWRWMSPCGRARSRWSVIRRQRPSVPRILRGGRSILRR